MGSSAHAPFCIVLLAMRTLARNPSICLLYLVLLHVTRRSAADLGRRAVRRWYAATAPRIDARGRSYGPGTR
jgi:hypothetical protein